MPDSFWWTLGAIVVVAVLGTAGMLFWYMKTYGKL